MRILQVSPYFSPRLGGSPQVVYQISRELSNRGHNLTVLAGDYGLKAATFPKESFQTAMMPSLISRWGFYFTPGIIDWCQKHIDEFDIIHLHEARTFQNIVVRWFARRKKIPYVLSAHGTLPVIVQRQIVKKAFDGVAGNAIVKSASALIAVSPIEVDQYRRAGICDERIRLIFNGLNLGEYANLPTRGEFRRMIPRLAKDARIILSVSRLHQIKGVDILIEAFSLLKTRPEKFFLAIIGPDDGELENLKALTLRLHVEDQVWFAGPRYGKEKLAAMVDADVLVSTASFEIFGLVPFEALMCGAPVIVAEGSGLGQIMKESGGGYLVPYGNASELARSIQHVLSHPEEARGRVEVGQKFIREHLDWNDIATQLENLYRSCIQ